MKYPILCEDKRIGFATVMQQGMTMLIRCICSEAEALNQIIYLGETPLGRCLPEGREYSLVRRIPKRDFPGEPRFVLGRTEHITQIILQEDSPVDGLERLQDARFSAEDEKPILLVTDQTSSSSTTGQ